MKVVSTEAYIGLLNSRSDWKYSTSPLALKAGDSELNIGDVTRWASPLSTL